MKIVNAILVGAALIMTVVLVAAFVVAIVLLLKEMFDERR